MKNDGHLIPIGAAKDLALGSVVRMLNSDGSVAPFSDAIVTEIEADCIRLYRPYARLVKETPQKGAEEYAITHRQLGNYRLVTLASGKPYIMAY